MRLSMLELVTFRSWKTLRLDFDGRVTVLTGGNGTGKTSIAEAAWYLASLGSHRTSADPALVMRGSDNAIVRGDVAKQAGIGDDGSPRIRTERIELEIVTKGRARAKLGGSPVGRRRDILGVMRAEIFAPERTAIVRGDPSDRRGFLDELLVQLAPRYHGVVREYERALRQRNALLRDAAAQRRAPAGIEAWDEALTVPGAELAAGRARAVELLTPHARAAFGAVGGDDSFAVSYLPNVPAPAPGSGVNGWADSMRERLAARAADERIRGVTLVGPHRDDLGIEIGGMPARTHASHGESWLAAMGLVLGAHAALAESIGEPPVLLLDDPFTLLDPERRLRLVGALPEDAQTVVTAADPSEVPAELGAEMVDVVAARR